jgi:hypothetical protein
MSEPWIDELLGDERVHPQFEAALRSRVLAAAHGRRRPRWLLPSAAALVALAGVATVVTFAAQRESGRSVPVEPSTGPTSPPVATLPVSTTSTIATTAPSTVPPTTEPPPSSAVAPVPPTAAPPELSTSAVPATEPPPNTEPPATTELATATPPMGAAGALDLERGTVFGLSASRVHDAATAVDLISRSLGAPTSDITEMTVRYCPEPAEFRIVRWNDFVLEFDRSGDTEYLSSWQLGDPGQEIAVGPVGPDPEPLGAGVVTTADGIGIGSPASALDRFTPIVSDPQHMILGGDVQAVAVTIRDGVIAGLWSGPFDWQCEGDEPR